MSNLALKNQVEYTLTVTSGPALAVGGLLSRMTVVEAVEVHPLFTDVTVTV